MGSHCDDWVLHMMQCYGCPKFLVMKQAGNVAVTVVHGMTKFGHCTIFAD